eukprot:COSAG06_NODE_35883_length_454_cov_1.152113_1_plen_67_part_10
MFAPSLSWFKMFDIYVYVWLKKTVFAYSVGLIGRPWVHPMLAYGRNATDVVGGVGFPLFGQNRPKIG